MKHYSPVRYAIDANDRLVEVNEAFWSFAANNDWVPDRDTVIGQPVWDFVSDTNIIFVYRHLVNVVREERKQACFPFRCDSPDLERHMTMAITYSESSHVHFIAELDCEIAWEFSARPHVIPPTRFLCPSCYRVDIEDQQLPLILALSTQFLDIGLHEIKQKICHECVYKKRSAFKLVGARQ